MEHSNFLKSLINKGVIIKDINTTFIDPSCTIGENTIIYPFNTITKNCVIGANCIIESNNYIENSIIGNNNKISFSYIQNSEIENNNNIGPYSRLREAKILNNCKVGNFVEVKKSVLNDFVKASHLTYIGDSEIGELTNIGCGVIFCNYNGKEKFKTKIGKNCFIGSNVNLIAPLEVGDNTYICAGATIYKNIDKDKFVISNRELVVKEDYKKIHIKKRDL